MFEYLRRLLILFDGDAGGGTGGGAGGDSAGDSGKPGDKGGDAGDKGGTGDTGEKDPSYASQFSPEAREKYRPYYKKHAKLNDLLEDYVKTADTLKNAIVVPDKEKATPEDMKAFYTKMGIAQSVEEFGLEVDDKNDTMKKLAAGIGGKMLEMGLTKNQGKKTWELVKGLISTGEKEKAAQIKLAEEKLPERLKTMYKDDSNPDNKTKETLNLFKAAMVRVGSKELVGRLEKEGFLYDPVFVSRMANIEYMLSDDKALMPGGGTGGNSTAGKGRMGDYSEDFVKKAGGKA